MNTKERMEFYTFLKENKNKANIDFSSVIKYPKNIFRYRSINTNSLSALLENKLYFSSSNYFDDPFDTNIYVDINKIEELLGKYINENTFDIKKLLLELEKSGFKVHNQQIENKNISLLDIKTKLQAFVENIRNEIKKQTYSACFSESEFNETLWLKYADNHKGFVVEYDIRQEEILCGQKEDCIKCINNFNVSLYPMIYTNEKHNATDFSKIYLLIKSMELLNLKGDLYYKLIRDFNNNFKFDRELISLVKKECHEYDLEWRIIGLLCTNDNKPIFKYWKPKSVTIGLRTRPEDKKLIKEISFKAGIDRIYEIYIDENGDLNKREYKNNEV